MKRRCAVCHKGHSPSKMVVDGFFSDAYFHLHCLNSEEGMRWREERASSNALYARYLQLATHGRAVTCPACHTQCDVYLKSRDVPFVWETACDLCGQVNLNGISAYDSDDDRQLVEELKSLKERFLRTIDGSISARMETISMQRGTMGRCACGGRFVIAAQARCSNCLTLLVDSYFHYASCV